MNIKAFTHGLKDPDMDYNCKGILSYISFATDDQTTYQAELVNASKSSEATVKKCLSMLENKGYIRRVYDGDERRVVYTLTTPVKFQHSKNRSL